MKNTVLPFLFILTMFLHGTMPLYSQVNKTISGRILDKETGEFLPWASVSFKNTPAGTISNKEGFFKIHIPEQLKTDTLVFNYMGYEPFLIEIQTVNVPLNIQLIPVSFELDEVVILPLTPEEYLKTAIDKIEENYAVDSFQTLSYYMEELMENNSLIENKEAIIKSYYLNYQDSGHNQHEILLYRKQSGEKILLPDSWDDDEEEGSSGDDEMDLNLGGPETVLSFNLNKQEVPFLDTARFSDFTFEFGDYSSFQGNELITIHFRGITKVDIDDDAPVNIKQKIKGTVLLDKNTYAFVSIDYRAEFMIPFTYNAILRVVGIVLKKPYYRQVARYEQYKGKWYPKDFRLNIGVFLKKTSMFKKAVPMDFVISQIFFVNEVKTEDISPIPKERQFNPDKKMDLQAHNDENITWSDINVLDE